MSLPGQQARRQPEQSEQLIAVIRNKLPCIFAALDHETAELEHSAFDMSQVAIVAGLCYLDFRLQEEAALRERFPALAHWFEEVGKRPSVVAMIYFDELGPSKTGQTEKTGTA